MNVRFRMPKLWGGKKFTGTFKEMALTTIATTISIVLTFGTTAWLEARDAEQARRLLAMTIIHDIDQSFDVIRKRLDVEEKGHGVACYVIENEDRLESIGEDTLMMFINYVTSASFDSNMEFKKMNENIFNSSQDSWRTLNDRKFLNNVQEFYNARAVLEQQSKEWFCFKKPITKEEEYYLFQDEKFKNTVDRCRWLLENKRLKNYMDYVSTRTGFYWGFLQLINLNEENKFLMNITEQDMEEFVNKTYMEIHPVKEKGLMGTWNAVLADKKNVWSYEFRKDHTFTTHQSLRYGHSMFRDKIVQRYTLSGTWSVEGDSLVMRYDMKSYKMEIDDSAISYPPHLADNVRGVKEELASEKMKPRLVKKLDQNNRTSHATNIDQSGTRMELTDDEGNTLHYQKKTTAKK